MGGITTPNTSGVWSMRSTRVQTPTVDVWLDGSQNTSDPQNITYGLKHLPTYVPTKGDAVLIYRGSHLGRTSRVVLGKLAGSPSPYPLPLGTLTPQGQHTLSGYSHWGDATATPPAGLGTPGDFFWNTTVPATPGSILFQLTSEGWVNVL